MQGHVQSWHFSGGEYNSSSGPTMVALSTAVLEHMERQGDLSPLVMHAAPQWRFRNSEVSGCPQGRTHS